jgi:hypothetical protein
LIEFTGDIVSKRTAETRCAMKYPHINVEETFDQLVREYGGGVVLKEKLGSSPDFSNADYLFHFEKVVAELKCMTEDNSDSPGIQSKVAGLLQEFYAAGKIESTEVNEENWKRFPWELQNAIYSVTTTAIQARVKKANKQIRETRHRLGLETYNGVLLIANDGLISMPPAAFVHSIAKYLRNNCSEISLFIFFTANIFAVVEDPNLPVVFWFSMQMEDRRKVEDSLIRRLGLSWQRMACNQLGVRTIDHHMQDEDMKAFWKAKNLPFKL